MSASLMSREDVAGRRAGRSTRFFVTGGTGFLGSHLAVALLKRGHPVCLLARSLEQQSAEDRVQALLDWFGLPADRRRELRIVEGDITRPGLGVEPVLLREVLQHTDEIVHCASNTAFSERKRVEVEAVNGGGLSQVLICARASSAYFFHHVSTAFVAGNTSGRCAEEPATPRGFHNAYEETKCRGERMVMAACRDAGLRLAIYRPSIVYGDSRTGRSLLFNALYHPVRTALFIRDLYEKDIREGGGRKAQEMGVRTDPDGTMRLPLRIEVAREGGINLIPVDFFTDAFLSIMEGAPDGGIFHLVNDRVTRLEELIDYTCRLLRVTGIEACGPEAFAAVPRNGIEMLFDRYVEPYVPYMRDARRFEATNSRALLQRSGVACPEFDYDMFARCMSFAIGAGWRSPVLPPRGVTQHQ
jgi:nucleoside-diphosphate-sugar epimerase